MRDDKNENNKRKSVLLKINIYVARYLFICILISVSILLLSFNISSANQFEKRNSGYFEKLEKPDSFNTGVIPLKLKDGRVFFKGSKDYSTIFNPTDNSFSKASPLSKFHEMHYKEGFVLRDGRLLFIGPYMKIPEFKFNSQLYALVKDDFENEQKKIHRSERHEYVSNEAFNFSMHVKALHNWSNLSLKEQEALWKPEICKNPELLKEYNNYVTEYDKSMYAQLYDPKADKFYYSGKSKVRRSSTAKLQLKNGKVFIIGGESLPIPMNQYIKNRSIIEFYDPITGEFEIINTDKEFSTIADISLLDDGRILVICGLLNKNGTFYTYYNPDNNTFSEIKKLELGFSKYLNLRNGNILFFTKGKTYSNGHLNINIYNNLHLFNPYTEELRYVGSLAISRGESSFSCIELQDGNILIFGGEKDAEKRNLGEEIKVLKSAEIFNLKTGKSKLIRNTQFGHLRADSILLDDGRVLILDRLYGNHELYIPTN